MSEGLSQNSEVNQNKHIPTMKEHVTALFRDEKMTVRMRGIATRDFLRSKNLNIADLALVMGIDQPNGSDDRSLLICVVKIQHKLGFKRVGWVKAQNGIFDMDTLKAFYLWYDNDREQEALRRAEQEALKKPAAMEKIDNNVELSSPNDVVFIGDSNAARMGWRLRGARGLAFGGYSSGAVLDIVKSDKGKKRLEGAKLAIIRVGGNDGRRDPERYTLSNVRKIVDVVRQMGVKEIRIVTRPPYSFKNKSTSLRRMSLARRDKTYEVFGKPGELRSVGNSRVGVIDAYDLLISKDGNLKRQFTPKRDPLHMRREGYVKLLEHIFARIGAKNALDWIA